MEFPSPDIFPHLSHFRERRLYCDVLLKFHQCPLRPHFFAHRIVLASFSSFFADLCQDDIPVPKGVKEISLPPVIEDETMNFIIQWMYNETPKIELMLEEDDEKGWSFLENLRLASLMLGIANLQQFLDECMNPADECMNQADEGEDLKPEGLPLAIKKEVASDSFEPFALTAFLPQNTILPSASEEDSGVEAVPVYLEEDYGGKGEGQVEPKVDKNEKVEGQVKLSHDVEGPPTEKKKKKRKNVPARRKKVYAAKQMRKDNTQVSEGAVTSLSLKKPSAKSPYVTSKIIVAHPDHASKDPVLSLYIADDTFRCPQCDFTRKGKGAGDQKFFAQCGKHLHREHGVIAPNSCFPCSFESCSTVLYTREAAKHHRRRSHEKPLPYQDCSICGSRLKNLKMHMIMMHGNESVPCQVCGKVFSCAKRAELHARIHVKKPLMDCKSDGCDFKTTSRKTLEAHSFCKHGILINPLTTVHQCEECDYKALTKFQIKKHYEHVHLHSSVKCPHNGCEKRFKNQNLTDRHYDRVHLSKDTVQCSQCEQVFCSKSGLNYHMWRVHRTGKNGGVKDDSIDRLERPFRCAYCNHTSALSGNVRKHVGNVHPELPIKYVDLRTI